MSGPRDPWKPGTQPAGVPYEQQINPVCEDPECGCKEDEE